MVHEKMISYPVGHSGQYLVFEDSVLNHFRVHQQKRWWSKEAGGQLFAQEVPTLNQLRIVLATGPRPTDKRTRTTYVPDRKAEQQEIDARHEQNLLFLGDWHTHPEYNPQPSHTDLMGISSGFKQSKHQLHAFVLVIVGLGALPENLYVGVHDASSNTRLMPIIT